MSTQHTDDEHILDLLAEAALGGLTAEESTELELTLGHAVQDDPEVRALELALAATTVALVPPEPELPPSLRQDLVAQGTALIGNRAAPEVIVRSRAADAPSVLGVIGWLAAAACLAIAAVGWLRTPGTTAPLTQDQLFAARESLLEAADAQQLAWGPWNGVVEAPVVAGVTGDVVWSDAEQRGYMTFTGLEVKDPTEAQYQLWIIDASRGMAQRISGGVFDASAGTFVVEFTPADIPVKTAAAFAITVEDAGGTWVSTMEKPVVIAAKAG